MKIDTIIFDAEGIVVDTETIWDKAQEKFFRRRGLVYDRRRIKHLLSGMSMVDGVRLMQQEYSIPGDPETLAQERIKIVKRLFEREVTFINGFKTFFERVRRTYKTCIATAMAEDLLEVVDRRLGLSKLFDGRIFSLADVSYRSKPNPDLFLYAASHLRSKPAHCVVIEDAPLGVEAAKRAGMRCIALTTTYDQEKLSKADLIVDSYSEIDLTTWSPEASTSTS